MRPHSLNRILAASLGLHAALLGVLALTASKLPAFPTGPLRVQILPAPEVRQPTPVPPTPTPAPPSRGVPREPARRSGDAPRRAAQIPEERIERDGRGVTPDGPPPRPAPRPPAEPPSAPAGPSPQPRMDAPPQIAARPTPEALPSLPAPRRDPPSPSEPLPRGSLSLTGPPRDAESLGLPSPSGGAPRRSLRDQIAGLGSGPRDGEAGEGKQTINLDSREPRFYDYLNRLKRRVEREWQYPEEAQRNGVSGELLIVFTINKTGVLTSIRLAESSGFPVLDAEALRAVKAAAPFDPFPPQLGDEPWNIRGFFRYNIASRSRRG